MNLRGTPNTAHYIIYLFFKTNNQLCSTLLENIFIHIFFKKKIVTNTS